MFHGSFGVTVLVMGFFFFLVKRRKKKKRGVLLRGEVFRVRFVSLFVVYRRFVIAKKKPCSC